MKLKEWKAFLDSIPDNEYTRELDYTQFTDSVFVDAEDPDAKECFVTFDGRAAYVVRGNAEEGVIEVFRRDNSGIAVLDENGDLQTEQKYGNVKIVKYAYTL